MKTATAKTRKEKHAELIKKHGKQTAEDKKAIKKYGGMFKDNPLNFEEIRKKAWSRK
jgi:hypothetical protein